MWTVVPDIYNVFTAPQIRALLFNWTYVRCYWRHMDNSMCVLLQTLCQRQHRSSSLRYVNLWARTYTMYLQLHIFRNQYSSKRICAAVGDISTIQCALSCKVCAKRSTHHAVYAMWTCGPAHIQCIYSSTYSGINIHLNVSALLLEIYRQFNVRYPAKFAPNAAHIHQITQCEMWSLTYSVFNIQLNVSPL
jgi:hypothetical protein